MALRTNWESLSKRISRRKSMFLRICMIFNEIDILFIPEYNINLLLIYYFSIPSIYTMIIFLILPFLIGLELLKQFIFQKERKTFKLSFKKFFYKKIEY